MSTLTAQSAPHSAAAGDARQPIGLHCVVAEFDTVDEILHAVRGVRDAGYTRFDAHVPFPVHGLDRAMGVRPTVLPWIVMKFGIIGCLTGIALQWWMNAANPNWSALAWLPTFVQPYNYPISGKPDWSFPANIPVIFELTVLFSAICAVFGMLALNNLPLFYNPLFNSRRIHRATDDKFFVAIDARDRQFNLERCEALLTSLGGRHVERVHEYPSQALPPRLLLIAPVVFGLLGLLPLGLIYMAWNSKSSQPRIHIVQDMDNQPKVKTQKAAAIFANGMGMRPPIEGTVARGDLAQDGHFFKGVVAGDWATAFPLEQLTIDDAFMARGQRQFNIYCSSCHGKDASGNGIVNQRALNLAGADGTTWVQASNLHDQQIRERAVGHLFNTITNGIRSMPPYADKLSVADRWAVVAYVRALQRSQHARLEDVPAAQRTELQQRQGN